jgi:hypothetical protein
MITKVRLRGRRLSMASLVFLVLLAVGTWPNVASAQERGVQGGGADRVGDVSKSVQTPLMTTTDDIATAHGSWGAAADARSTLHHYEDRDGRT